VLVASEAVRRQAPGLSLPKAILCSPSTDDDALPGGIWGSFFS
jgi:hypothetical protein